MINRLTLSLLFFLITLPISAQTNVCVDKDCIERNAAIFSQSFINLKGKDFVSKLLDDNVSFLMFCDVDSLGYVVRINKISSKKKITKKLVKEIESYLVTDSVSFCICYEMPPGLKERDAVEQIRKGLRSENKTTYLLNVGFPGYLMTLYNYECDKSRNKGVILSKYEYLQSQIEKYRSK